jgi:rod shape-determining protein MreD
MLYAAALLATALVDGAWMGRAAVLGVKPDLVLVLVSALALRRGPEVGASAGFAGGLLQDLLGGQSLGLLAGPKVVVGFVLGLFARTAYLDNLLTPFTLVAAGTVAAEVLGFGLSALTGYPLPSWPHGATAVAVAACYNGVVAPLVFAWVRRTERWLQRADSAA